MYRIIYLAYIIYFRLKRIKGSSSSFYLDEDKYAKKDIILEVADFVLNPKDYCFSSYSDCIDKFKRSKDFSFAEDIYNKYDWYEFNKFFGIFFSEDKIEFVEENNRVIAFKITARNLYFKKYIINIYKGRLKNITKENLGVEKKHLLNDLALLKEFMDASAQLSWNMIASCSLF